MTEITLIDLHKHSLNEIYAGKSWHARKKDKDTYALLIKSQVKEVFTKDAVYEVDYKFYYKSRPLDCSNVVYSLKMIEDVLFEDDSNKIVRKLSITSEKGPEDKVTIKVNKIAA
ncbi:hypothetical protein AAU57_12055 [Nonlabens sp. YIK11]|uniref:hypothetical protein n=1 Tax=Nonlabens sp. YIK11 TaxID=1453349 RepID=UPI0006DC9F21|nr:hypothetical protein [Nonlabens sp. YIK11]KQC33981.1 hypothetical protein AAU57_12055 [Nonlabens sp. YIK11]